MFLGDIWTENTSAFEGKPSSLASENVRNISSLVLAVCYRIVSFLRSTMSEGFLQVASCYQRPTRGF